MPNEPLTSTAAVATDRGPRYGKQLASHLGRRLDTAWDEENARGVVRFDDAVCDITSQAAYLKLAIQLNSRTDEDAARERFEQIESVIGRHLVRFGTRDELVVEWRRSDGTPGGTYRHTDDAGEPDQHGRPE